MVAGKATRGSVRGGEAKRRRRRTPDEIRNRLLIAAGDEFRRKGYAATTTAAIARQADVAEIQMFRYFPSKASLFREAVFTPLIEHFRTFNAEHAPEAVDRARILESARLYVKELQHFLGEHAAVLVSLFVAQTYATPALDGPGPGADLQGFFEECAALMSARAGAPAGPDPRNIVRVGFAALLGCITYRDWMFPDAAGDQAEIDDLVIEFILAGIAPHSDLGPAGGAQR